MYTCIFSNWPVMQFCTTMFARSYANIPPHPIRPAHGWVGGGGCGIRKGGREGEELGEEGGAGGFVVVVVVIAVVVVTGGEVASAQECWKFGTWDEGRS